MDKIVILLTKLMDYKSSGKYFKNIPTTRQSTIGIKLSMFHNKSEKMSFPARTEDWQL